MTTVRQVEQALYEWAPRQLAASWDNVGHLVGDPDRGVHRVLVSLDITERVVREAVAHGTPSRHCALTTGRAAS